MRKLYPRFVPQKQGYFYQPMTPGTNAMLRHALYCGPPLFRANMTAKRMNRITPNTASSLSHHGQCGIAVCLACMPISRTASWVSRPTVAETVQ